MREVRTVGEVGEVGEVCEVGEVGKIGEEGEVGEKCMVHVLLLHYMLSQLLCPPGVLKSI